jgi:hypothetical protein
MPGAREDLKNVVRAFNPWTNAKLGGLRGAYGRGVKESLGWYYEGTVNRGFMGLGKSPMKRAARMPRQFAKLAGRKGFGAVAKHGLSRIGKVVPFLGTAYMAYSGYQENGVMGAVGGIAESMAYSVAWQAGSALVGSTALAATGGIAIAAAGAYGYYKFGEAAQEHRKRVTGLEFGAGSTDVLMGAGALTARQRAMSALNSTHINARIAIGNEALLTHSSYK